MKENQSNKQLEIQPEWYLNLREFRIEVTPGEVPGTVKVERVHDQSFRDAIKQRYVASAQGDDVIDIESEVIKEE